MRIVLIPVLALTTGFAIADDGWLGYPGSPKQFSAKPTVRMASERVTVVIHRWHAEVRCEFAFENLGPAVAVKMGFPDFHSNGEEGSKANSIYDRFKSYVDGGRVRTTLEPKVYTKLTDGPPAPAAFQTKVVRFRANQRRRVLETYSVSLGSLALGGKAPNNHYPAIKAFDYIFHTGSTWRDTIGKATMTITFAKDATFPKSGAIHLATSPSKNEWTYEFFALRRQAVFLHGAACNASGRTLTLIRSNWKPTRADDIQITFGLHLRDIDNK